MVQGKTGNRKLLNFTGFSPEDFRDDFPETNPVSLYSSHQFLWYSYDIPIIPIIPIHVNPGFKKKTKRLFDWEATI